MKSRWNDTDAARFVGDLAQRVYSSRLLGADASLVMHGGGNTSVKTVVTDVFGEDEDVIYVKGSGWDLETIEPQGFAPCRTAHLLRLAKLKELSDTQMAIELRKSLADPNAPSPSVEAILHAILPARFVDHTHSDAILSICNSPNGERRIREIYGGRVVVIPYVMPGFRLARLCAELFPANATSASEGMLLMNHGLFTFGDTARVSYERMIELVTRAEDYLAKRNAWVVAPGTEDSSANHEAPGTSNDAPSLTRRTEIAALRKAVSQAAGAPMILAVHSDSRALRFARRADVAEIAQQGPATPDHVIRTKRTPLVGRNVEAFVSSYKRYFEAHAAPSSNLKMLDPAPRVILDPVLGFCSCGRTARDARVVEDIYRHTMDIILRSTELGGWRALSAQDIFDVEYWDLEQAKLKRSGPPLALAGEVALVTGAASGIGKACVESMLNRGSAVVGLDVDDSVVSLQARPDYLGLKIDLTAGDQLGRVLDKGVSTFGGIDLLILNAGIFPSSAPIAALPDETWRRVFSINLDANLVLLRQCYLLLKLAPRGGRVVIIGSRNVAAPGPGAAAYSASKAALQQVARVAALEWSEDNIRVNTIHPDAVFDTGLWTPEMLASRAASYGTSIEEYKTRNLLRVEVKARDVAELAAELCGPLFAKTTGAQIPVDGGNVRVV